MPIQITPNAAALSWLALSESLDSRAVMEGAIFNLLGNNTNMSLKQTTNQAVATETALEKQADQTMTQGLMGMVGSGVSVAVTLGTTAMQGYNERQANKLSASTSTKVGIEEVAPPSAPESLAKTNISSSSNVSVGKLEIPEQSAEVTVTPSKDAKPAASSSSAPSAAQDKAADSNLSSADKAAQQRFENNASWWLQNGRTFSDISNQLISSGVSNLLIVNDIKAQGQAKAAEAYAQGFNQVFGTQNGIFTSALQSCDTFMSNTNSTIAAIIAASKG